MRRPYDVCVLNSMLEALSPWLVGTLRSVSLRRFLRRTGVCTLLLAKDPKCRGPEVGIWSRIRIGAFPSEARLTFEGVAKRVFAMLEKKV